MSEALTECPHCGSEDLDTGPAHEIYKRDEPELIRTVSCDKCGNEWTEIYRCVEVTD